METVLGLLILPLLSAVCWLAVFSKPFRDRIPRRPPGPLDYYESEEERLESEDALIKGLATIPAVIFTLISILCLIVVVIGLSS